ncbi:MAG: DUF6356 family protein [Gammaproteobacteria bacterium]|nr:DUF6356 family protein [Gammaproteobacteria bacterium]MDH3411720.1 DUF6356 family protein [Gammaproteobacteria bacterium]
MSAKFLTRHLNSVDETYFQHLAQAMRFAGTLAVAATVCFVHALLPFLFERTGSTLIGRLYDRMVLNRRRKDAKEERFSTSVSARSA